MMKKPSTASAPTSASAAAQLLVGRNSRRAVATDESIEFFSALRDCQSDPPIAVQTGRRPEDESGKVSQRGGGGGRDDGELLSTEIGKHDYDWLLTPPATPRQSPGTGDTATVSAAALNRLARATLASYAKNNSPLSMTRRGNGINPTSRLARSSSVANASVNTTAIVASSSRGLSHVRTLSSASSSSSPIIAAARNASGSSTPMGSTVTTPRTPPAHARSTGGTANARSQPWDKAQARQASSAAGSTVSRQRKAPSSSSSGLPSSTPTSARRPRATIGASSPRSTTMTSSQQPEKLTTTIRGANAVARSMFASHGVAGSTARSASTYATHGVRPSTKPQGPVSAAAGVKHCYGNGMAVASTATKRWSSSVRSPSSAVAVAAAGRESALRRELSAKRLSTNGEGRLSINLEKAATLHRTAAGLDPAAVPRGLTRTASRKPANTDAKRTGKENVDDGRKCKDVKPTAHHRIIRSTASRSRPGSMAVTYDSGSGSIAGGGQCTSEKKGKFAVAVAAAAAARLTEETEAPFASTRYDSMLSREDPKNLTWLNGCGVDGDHDGSGVAGLVEGLLEPFDVPV